MEQLLKSDFYFDLPEELIAQDPLEDRSSSRLLVLDKNTGDVEHHVFREIIDYLQPGDCLVVNNTKVIPASPPRDLASTTLCFLVLNFAISRCSYLRN